MSWEKIVLIIDPKRRVFPHGTKPYGSKMKFKVLMVCCGPLKTHKVER